MLERLQKVLAAAGVASRRDAEEMIASGRVQVDGRRITALGTKVDPDQAAILVDGRPITPRPPALYVALHKPAGFDTTRADPHAPHTVMELVLPALEGERPRAPGFGEAGTVPYALAGRSARAAGCGRPGRAGRTTAGAGSPANRPHGTAGPGRPPGGPRDHSRERGGEEGRIGMEEAPRRRIPAGPEAVTATGRSADSTPLSVRAPDPAP